MRAKSISVFAFVLSAVAVLPVAGHAAPQILGLVATAAPVPMHCADGVCSVEISGVCLQEYRPAPETGTAYRAAPGSDLTLVVRQLDGTERTLAVAELVEITSLRVFNSVSISLPAYVVQDLHGEGAEAFFSVGPLASALPVAVRGDQSPLTETEIREYTGPSRAIAEQAIGGGKANVTATRILNRMINRLPPDGNAGAERIATLRDRTMGENAAPGPQAAKLVDRALDTCRENLRVEQFSQLRACLASQHDILNSDTTQNVWRKLRPGS